MRENQSLWFLTWSETNRCVLLQKKARNLKFQIYIGEELYYLSSENKSADQLCSYCKADLRLCFRICKNVVFSCVFRETLLGQLTVHHKQIQEQFAQASNGKYPKGKNLPEFVNLIVFIRQLEAKVLITNSNLK